VRRTRITPQLRAKYVRVFYRKIHISILNCKSISIPSFIADKIRHYSSVLLHPFDASFFIHSSVLLGHDVVWVDGQQGLLFLELVPGRLASHGDQN